MEANRRSAFSVRRGFLLVLVFVLGAVFICAALYGGKYLFREDIGLFIPTRSFAHQVAYELVSKISDRVRTPAVLYRWRSTGSFDEEPSFSESALFWFTYNSLDSSYIIRLVNLPLLTSQDVLEGWKQRLTPLIDSTLNQKKAGGIWEDFKSEVGDFRLEGKIYKDEPKVVGMITDMDNFRLVDLPELLREMEETVPLLEGFATGPEEGPGNSMMLILARDRQDSIIAQLGVPGEYAYKKDVGTFGFKKKFPYMERFGFSFEIVIPNCVEKVWLWYIRWGFFGLVALWVLAMILWGWAEIRLRKLRS